MRERGAFAQRDLVGKLATSGKLTDMHGLQSGCDRRAAWIASIGMVQSGCRCVFARLAMEAQQSVALPFTSSTMKSSCSEQEVTLRFDATAKARSILEEVRSS